jgi:hypothetical protein
MSTAPGNGRRRSGLPDITLAAIMAVAGTAVAAASVVWGT